MRKADRVYEPFYRGQSRRAKVAHLAAGSGLALAVRRRRHSEVRPTSQVSSVAGAGLWSSGSPWLRRTHRHRRVCHSEPQQVAHGAAYQDPVRRASRSPVHGGKRVAETSGRPLLDCSCVASSWMTFQCSIEDPVLDPEDVCRNPVHGRPETGEATMHYHEVAVSYDHALFVFQRRRHALDQVEQPLPAGCDVPALCWM